MKIIIFITFFFLFVAAANAEQVITLSDSNTVSLSAAVDDFEVARLQNELTTKCAANPGQDITLVLYTPGGSVVAGRNFIDFVRTMDCKVNTLTIFAASMGYQFIQGLGNRYVLPGAIIMSHRAAINGVGGQIPGEANTRIGFYTDYSMELDEMAAKRVGLSLSDYRLLVLNEFWATGKTAVTLNHADEVVLAKCDSSLSGSVVKRIDTMFFSYDVTFSNCPLITGPLNVVPVEESENAKKEIPALIKRLDLKSNFGVTSGR